MFSGKFTTAVVLLAALASSVHGHGQMISPKGRPVTAKYRADCYGGLKGAGDNELLWAPVENLIERKQADQPYAATFDVMNGCRGMIYESANPVTEVTAGADLPIEYYIQAPHPGYAEFYIVRPKTDAAGKITYERDPGVLKRIDNFATNSDGKAASVTIPANIAGCTKPGECALQFYWHSDIAKQTYPTCADIVVKGGSGGAAPAPAPAPATTTAAPSADTPATTTAAPSASTAPAPATPTTAPATTPAPANGGSKCVPKRFRQL